MVKSILKNAAVGGLIVFLWTMVSWMVFPWHQYPLKKFANESAVANVISENAPNDGIYILPNTLHYSDKTSKKEISQGMQMLENGPFVFASVRKGGMGKMTPTPFLISLITQFIGALIVCWMLAQTKGLKFKKQVAFVTLFGIGIGIVSQIPNWNWWGFSACYTRVSMLDYIVGWFLAGLAIAKLNKASFKKG